jgi:hypothetical protein
MCAVINILIASVLLGISVISVASQPNDWRWFSSSQPRLANFQMSTINDDGALVAAIGRNDIYRGPLFGIATGVASDDFAYINTRSRFLCVPNGAIMVAGNTSDLQSFGLLRFDDIRSTHKRLVRADLDGEGFPIGLSAADYSVLGFEALQLLHTYSFDAGRTWYRMLNDGDVAINSQQSFSQLLGSQIIAKSVASGTWFIVDTITRTYKPAANVDADMCQFALLTNGAGLALKCIEGDETQLMFRQSEAETWAPVPNLETPEGSVIDIKRYVYGRSDFLHTTKTGKAVFFLDSGYVIEYNGTTISLRSMVSDAAVGRLTTGPSVLVRGRDRMRLVYQSGIGTSRRYAIATYSLADESVDLHTGLLYAPEDVSSNGYLHAGPFFTDWASGRARPVITAVNADGNVVDQPYVSQVILCSSTPVVAVDNTILIVDDPGKLPHLSPIPDFKSTQSSAASSVLNRVTIQALPDSSFIIPGITPRVVDLSGKSMSLPVITGIPSNARATCANTSDPLHPVIAGTFVASFNGASWEVIPYPEHFTDQDVVVSSVVTRGRDTIILAARGHGFGSSTIDSFVVRKGGIVVSTNRGQTWQSRPLPLDEQWVESLTQAPNGSLYCWATNMVLDQSFASGGAATPRYGSARLYSSPDLGITWTEEFLDRADDLVRRPAPEHQWSISATSAGAMTISCPEGAYVSPTAGLGFQQLTDLPFNSKIAGSVISDDGNVWVVGSHGISRRSILTGVREGNSKRSELVVSPNPASDLLTIHVNTPHSLYEIPDCIPIYHLDGRVAREATKNGAVYLADVSDLPSGIYVVRSNIGGTVASAKVVVP